MKFAKSMRKTERSHPVFYARNAVVVWCLLTSFSSPSFAQQRKAASVRILQKADSLQNTKDLKQAEIAYLQVLVLNDSAVSAYEGLGQITVTRKDWADSQRWFRQALALSPESEIAHDYFCCHPRLQSMLKSARAAHGKGNLKKTKKLYAMVLEMDKQSLEGLKTLGKLAYDSQHWRAFRGYFAKVLEIAPGDEEALYYFSNPMLQARLRMADSLLTQNKVAAAVQAYETAVAINPNSIEALCGLANTYRLSFDWKNSRKWLKRALTIDSRSMLVNIILFETTDPQIAPLLETAEKARAERDFDKAKNLYQEALKLYAGTIPAFRGLAELAFKAQNWGDAKKWYEDLLEVQPDDLSAMYALGVVHREIGKRNTLLIKRHHFKKSQEYLDRVVATDSTFNDVLFQRGLLERWRGNWRQAIGYTNRQIQINPDLADTQVGRFKLYHIAQSKWSDREFQRWFDEQTGFWLDYIKAEWYRENKQFTKAEAIFRQILDAGDGFPRLPVYLSLIRLNVQKGDEESAHKYFLETLDTIDSDVAAAFVFEQCKYIFTNQEYMRYALLQTPGEKATFFRRFWTSRNPMPAASINLRVIEHFRRMVYAEENYRFYKTGSRANNPDRAGQLSFPMIYQLNEDFNDKGLIYIRHGEPDEIAITAGVEIDNESWLYYKHPERPKLIFHLLLPPTGRNHNWRLVASLPETRMILDRLGWDKSMDRLYLNEFQAEKDPFLNRTGYAVKETSYFNEILDDSRHYVAEGLSTDEHTWDRKYKGLELGYMVTNFRGRGGKTNSEVYFVLPMQQFGGKDGDASEIVIEHGAGVYDILWTPVSKSFQVTRLNARAKSGTYIAQYQFLIEPGTYNFTIHVHDKDNSRIAFHKFKTDVPSFAGEPLAISDLLLAYEIREVGSGNEFTKGELAYIPNPGKTFQLSEIVAFYCELYNMTYDKEGTTSYDIEIQLTLLKKKKSGLSKFLPFRAQGKSSVSVKEHHSGTSHSPTHFINLDVSKLEPGLHKLTVEVTDLNTGTSATRSSEVELTSK